MARYGYGGDALDQYQNTPFDPLSGRLNGGQLVMQVLNQIAGNKRKKQEDDWELEDRAAQQVARGLQAQGATLDIAAKKREAQDYRSPELDAFMKRLDDKRKAKAELEKAKKIAEINKNATIAINQAKPVKSPTELNDDYLADVEAASKRYSDYRMGARAELQKAMTALINNKFAYQDPAEFTAAQQKALDEYNSFLETLDAREKIEAEAIDERYSDLPRAQLSKKRRESKTTATAPGKTPPPVIKTSGGWKRSELPKGADVRVGPDGKKYVKIDGLVYEVIG
jgi:hypothetical protein